MIIQEPLGYFCSETKMNHLVYFFNSFNKLRHSLTQEWIIWDQIIHPELWFTKYFQDKGISSLFIHVQYGTKFCGRTEAPTYSQYFSCSHVSFTCSLPFLGRLSDDCCFLDQKYFLDKNTFVKLTRKAPDYSQLRTFGC